MKLSKWKSIFPYLFFVAALLVFAAYLYRNADRYQQLFDFSPWALLLLVGLVLTFVLCNGVTNYLFYRGLGIPVSLNEGIGLASVNTLANQLPFAGGMIAKGVYLKQRYELAYTRYLSATLALYVCFVAANGAIGVTVLVYMIFLQDADVPLMLVLGFAGMAASVALLWLPIKVDSVPGRWGRQLARLMDGWKVLGERRVLLGQLVGLQIIMTLIFSVRLWIAFRALSQDVILLHCVLFSAATILTRLVSIAPGGLGVREVIVASVASVLGFEAGVSVVAVGLERLIATLVIIALGTVYTYVLSKNVASAQPNPEAQ